MNRYILSLIFIGIVFSCTGQQKNNLRTLQYSPRSSAEAEIWQKDLRARLGKLMKMDDLMKATASNPLNIKEISKTDKGQYIIKEVEFNSTPGRRIKVLLTIPTWKKTEFPAVVCIHGHGGQLYSVYQDDTPYKGFASQLASSGYITIAPVVSQHTISEENRSLMGERLWDLMRCVDLLESLPQTDRSNIGCAGLSLGGEMAMWLGAMDQRIKATVSSGFLTRMDQMEQGHCMCWKFEGLRELVDYADIYSLIAPRYLLCQNGLKEPPADFTVELAKAAMAEIELIYKDFGKTGNVSLIAHPEGHVVDVKSLMEFFSKTLN